MTVSVFAPISIGNISVGFDSLGLAVRPIDNSLLGDIVHISESSNNTDQLTVSGQYAKILPENVQDNIVWSCLQKYNSELQKQSISLKKVSIELEKNVPVCSGLGSSSCSVVAAFYALNEFYQMPFNEMEMLDMMVDLEAKISGGVHYDNVAPCYLGGMQLIQSSSKQVARSIPIFDDCYWVMAYADMNVSTKEARSILPNEYSRETLISFGQNLAGFIDACYQQNKELAFAGLVDLVAEPYRAPTLPKYINAKQTLMEYGALAVGISGSGPTIFVATDEIDIANQCADWLKINYAHQSGGFVHICKTDSGGAVRI